MTHVAFHTGLDDPLGYACRLLRKAVRQGARAMACADEPTLDMLDKALWTFDPQDFVPHLRWRAGQVLAPHLVRTPLWLVGEADAAAVPGPPVEVLVRLGVPQGLDLPPSLRVIELVGSDDTERRAARQRWRAYEARGVTVQHHPAAAR